MSTTDVRPLLPLPTSRPAIAAHLADDHHQTRLVGQPDAVELDWEHWTAHGGDCGLPGHVHDWSRWGRGER